MSWFRAQSCKVLSAFSNHQAPVKSIATLRLISISLILHPLNLAGVEGNSSCLHFIRHSQSQ